MLKRKLYNYLANWKNDSNKKPVIIKGARQIGKTETVRLFAREHYNNFIEINFALQKKFRDIFDDGFEVETILKNISVKDSALEFIPGETLIFFDELQACPNCATSLKSFCQDKRFDVICSGSLMGIHYQQIESNSVGFKTDYKMYSMDFEEFLWAKGYSENQIEDLYSHLKNLVPFTASEFSAMSENFRDYIITGGMPEVVNKFVQQKNFSGILELQKQLLLDYEEDISKYAEGIDKAKVKSVYKHIPVFLAKQNKKFQISKIATGARNREYVGTVEWLDDAGVVNVCYCLELPELPLRGNYNPKDYKLYYHDTGLLIASLDDEAQKDLRENKNFNVYKGAIFENVVAEAIVKSGGEVYFYRNEKSTIEMDFFMRDADSLIPVEVKSNDGATISLRNLIEKDQFSDIKYGIKLCNKNLGFNGKFYTIPYFCAFMLKRWLNDNGRVTD